MGRKRDGGKTLKISQSVVGLCFSGFCVTVAWVDGMALV